MVALVLRWSTCGVEVMNACANVVGLLIITSLTGIVGTGIAVIFHEGSTIVVALNPLWLLGYRETNA